MTTMMVRAIQLHNIDGYFETQYQLSFSVAPEVFGRVKLGPELKLTYWRGVSDDCPHSNTKGYIKLFLVILAGLLF